MSRLRRLAAAALIAALPGFAAADEPSGCGAFKWPLEQERIALAGAGKSVIANGGALAYDVAATLKLALLADAGTATRATAAG